MKGGKNKAEFVDKILTTSLVQVLTRFLKLRQVFQASRQLLPVEKILIINNNTKRMLVLWFSLMERRVNNLGHIDARIASIAYKPTNKCPAEIVATLYSSQIRNLFSST